MLKVDIKYQPKLLKKEIIKTNIKEINTKQENTSKQNHKKFGKYIRNGF